jgi:uncharacterized protein with HEPN domain
LGATRDAVLYNVVVIGEAAAHLGDDTRVGAPQIPWPKIVGYETSPLTIISGSTPRS